MADTKTGSKSRSKIQESIDKARQEQRLDIFRKRIDLAKQGIKAFELNRNPDAIKSFSTYLRILEEWKEVPPGGLNPTLFSIKKDVPELLLINGVYLTMIKIYDRAQDSNRKEFSHYLEKYLVFSKGMPFQNVAAENLRKYIHNGRPIHRGELQNAYKMIGTGGCFIATALQDVLEPSTLPTLRRFRDEVLQTHAAGRVFVKAYYKTSPLIAKRLEKSPQKIRKILGRGVDSIARGVQRWV